MTRWIVGGTVYAMAFFSLAFGVVLLADRRLGVAAPYSILLAPVVVPAFGALMLLCRDSILARAAVPFARCRAVHSDGAHTTRARQPGRGPVPFREGFMLLGASGPLDGNEAQ